ncbi:MAG TPA: hypothetical protein VMT95_05070 [Candidatus Binatia bacterium]|nr:hypothetical protein [Candidatus Binatia bacterium]
MKEALCFAAAMLTTNLYVADRLQKAVIAFDVDGKKIAEYNARAEVFDVVTDSSGHVYVIYAARNGTDEVKELSHDLSSVIATYTPGNLGFSLAIDVDDNLYVGHETKSGVYVYQYRYGSTRVAAVYRLPQIGPMILGISVRNGIIYAPVEAPFGTYSLFACKVGATNSCRLVYDISAGEDCGFTTTGSFVEITWFGRPFTIRKFEQSRFQQRGEFDLPPNYGPGWNSFCALHNYGTAVWLPIANSSTGPPLAIEMDMRNGDILARIGAGTLYGPVAAFFGNGFTP